MSISVGIKLVEWDRLWSARLNGRHVEVFVRALDDDEPWVTCCELPETVELGSAIAAANDAYNFVRSYISPDLRQRLDSFIYATFAGYPHRPLNDLGLEHST